jgi:hypothetical protein
MQAVLRSASASSNPPIKQLERSNGLFTRGLRGAQKFGIGGFEPPQQNSAAKSTTWQRYHFWRARMRWREGAPEVGFVSMEVTCQLFCASGIAITASAQFHPDGPPTVRVSAKAGEWSVSVDVCQCCLAVDPANCQVNRPKVKNGMGAHPQAS